MAEVTGMDHVYIADSGMTVSEQFYDKVLVNTLGFRKIRFELNRDPHIQYYNRRLSFLIRMGCSLR
jgi:hypothetical protein